MATFDRTTKSNRTAPAAAYQAPDTNSTCHASGLKYHSPRGQAGRFQSNRCTAKYSRNDPASVSDGARLSSQSNAGNPVWSSTKVGSTSVFTGVYCNSMVWTMAVPGLAKNTPVLVSSRY